ncbi:peptidoglycan DD-metalloendopeptidase family protein [Candidatus Microgenomates bacterium]|nr:peptidoglycan DD-metalloendopeptidase family protein [Candidatus Microgenomates bacterium]
MADQIEDNFELQLTKDVDSANEEANEAVKEFALAEKKRWDLTQVLQKELLRDSKSRTVLIERFRNENFTLKQAINLAGEQNPNALSASGFWTFDEPPDLDKLIQTWVYEAKSGQVKDLEKLLFGDELAKPEKTTIAEKSAAIFQSPETNWTTIANIYKQESKAREDTIDAYQRALFALAAEFGRELAFPSGPTTLRLRELEGKHEAAQRQLKHYQELVEKNRLYLNGIAEGRWTEEEIERGARDLAQEQLEKEAKPKEELAKTGEKVTLQSPVEKAKETEAREIKPKPAKKPSEAELIRQRLVESGEIEGTWTFRDYLRHPIGGFGQATNFLRGYLEGLFGRAETGGTGTVTEAALTKAETGVASKAAGAGAKKVAGTVAKKVAPGVVAKLAGFIPTGVTQVAAIASVIKDILGAVKGIFTNPAIRDAIRDAGVAVAILLKLLVDFILSSGWTIAGAALGGFVGFAIGGPLGALVGAGLGAWLVGTVGPQIWASITGFTSGVGTAGTAAATSVAGIGATAVSGVAAVGGSVVAALTAAVTGGSAIVLIAVGTMIVGTLITLVTTAAAFVSPPSSDIESQGPDPQITVVKTVDQVSLPNDSGKSLGYSLIFSAGDAAMTITSVIDETTANGNTIASPTPSGSYPSALAAGETKEIKFQPFSVAAYNNSTVVNTVTVETTTADGKTKETKTAVAVTTIGTTPNNQPYGFPAAGQVYSLDTSFWKASGQHRGTFFTGAGSRYWEPGGMDILNSNGNVPVYSTVKGTVIFSKFDLGDPATAGKCRNISTVPVGSSFSDCAVGGAVIIQAGNYTVSYLHLNSSLAVGISSSVDRGTPLGTTYAGASGGIPTVNGWHVHYQILYNGAPFYFNQAPLGKCSQGAVLPSLPKFGDSVTATTACQ